MVPKLKIQWSFHITTPPNKSSELKKHLMNQFSNENAVKLSRMQDVHEFTSIMNTMCNPLADFVFPNPTMLGSKVLAVLGTLLL